MPSTRAYEMLREIVRDCGARLESEDLGEKKSGLISAEFVGRTNLRFRLRWDLKGKRGVLQVQGPDKEWKGEGAEVVKNKAAHYSNLRAFMHTAERLSGTRLGGGPP